MISPKLFIETRVSSSGCKKAGDEEGGGVDRRRGALASDRRGSKDSKFPRVSTSTAAVKANRDLSTKLCEDAGFNYKDVDAGTGFAENSIFLHMRRAVLFKNKKALGFIFASHFNPYPFVTAALDFTAVNHCAKEWSTGQFVQADFQEKDILSNYNTHLQDIQRWADLDQELVLRLRTRWYTRASRALGVEAKSGVHTNITQTREELLRQELAGRTGETDSENEGGDEAE
ncbi:hypothetical protein C8R46DRAFT_1224092 [Mycena filopes]|nr:hypothetical protein C8R46DRAFT_1224092 [Mycena filopes]